MPPVELDPYQGVDTVMANMVMLADDADQKLTSALEGAMAELLSVGSLTD